MTRYLIEVPHDNTKEACDQAVRAFLASGSHFVTHADWGCPDDVHKAWLIVELDSKEEAIAILPPAYRVNAKVVTLEQYSSLADLDGSAEEHGG